MLPELLRLGLMAGFVALGLRVRRAADEAGRLRAARALVLYVLFACAAAGLSQRDAWPFTSHTIAVGRARAETRSCTTELFGLDQAGRAWRLDPYSFTPVYDSILRFWIEQALPGLAPAQREQALAFLLQRAEASRARLAAGERLGHERLLGPLGSPYWLLLPRVPQVPSEPYRGLRADRVCWNAVELVEGRGGQERATVLEWRR